MQLSSEKNHILKRKGKRSKENGNAVIAWISTVTFELLYSRTTQCGSFCLIFYSNIITEICLAVLSGSPWNSIALLNQSANLQKLDSAKLHVIINTLYGTLLIVTVHYYTIGIKHISIACVYKFNPATF